MTDFKTKMAELAKKYNISHKRDIDWHNFVYEVQQLTEAKENPKSAISIPADCVSNAKCPYKIHGDEEFIGDIRDTPAYHFGFDEGVRSEKEKQRRKSDEQH